MTAGLVEFLLARLEEDEDAARTAIAWRGRETWRNDIDGSPEDAHIARHDPARVLADVGAKRAIVKAWRSWGDNPSGEMRDYGHEEGLEQAIELLAAIYAEHPDYQQEWTS